MGSNFPSYFEAVLAGVGVRTHVVEICCMNLSSNCCVHGFVLMKYLA